MSKPGSGGIASNENLNVQRRERLRALAMENADLSNDPYFMKNHLGSYECRLCLTLHTNEGSYMAHTQGKRHQQNLAKRAAREAQANGGLSSLAAAAAAAAAATSATAKQQDASAARRLPRIGRPGYKIIKQFDPVTRANSLLIQLQYPESSKLALQPRHRFMSTFEQKREPIDRAFQYLLVAGEPYEIVAFKIPNQPIDTSEGAFVTHWDEATGNFTIQLKFRPSTDDAGAGAGAGTASDLARRPANSSSGGGGGLFEFDPFA